MSSGRHLGGIATAGTPGGGDDESGFRSQPESSRISPITGGRQSLIFGRCRLTMDIHLYPFEMTVSPSYRRILVRRRRGQGVVEPSNAALLFASDRLKAKATHAPPFPSGTFSRTRSHEPGSNSSPPRRSAVHKSTATTVDTAARPSCARTRRRLSRAASPDPRRLRDVATSLAGQERPFRSRS